MRFATPRAVTWLAMQPNGCRQITFGIPSSAIVPISPAISQLSP